ncbi:MAG TPA: group III truncated hemoglobin [Bacteroidia bacterium]|nr:group III truncated hemoglobin [Bacteroidia bacterium]
MKADIKDRRDIELLINTFYEKVKVDSFIGFFFTDVVKVNWDKHLPVMYDFWESVVFHTGIYDGNPMEKHIDLNKKSPMKMEHFQRWMQLFNETVDELFAGAKADVIKQRAISIATVMQIKIFG